MPRVESVKRRAKILQRRVRRGRKKSNRDEARVRLRLVASRWEAALRLEVRPLSAGATAA
jgi:hypothetical protein